MFPLWLKAGFWGLVGGSALLLGSAVGYYAKIPPRAMSSDKPQASTPQLWLLVLVC
ncbi:MULTISPECIES: hypothetical protein [unclassified Nostoc]|uniref:hypothetical protein n=1 Tax=unclassified Nostoc TaxID=2593658 RepID=UPI001C8AB8FC|nr:MULTISPECIES: hypothetical protein [unclassified Nostoc]